MCRVLLCASLCVCVSLHCGCGVAVWWCVQCGVVGGLVVSSSAVQCKQMQGNACSDFLLVCSFEAATTMDVGLDVV